MPYYDDDAASVESLDAVDDGVDDFDMILEYCGFSDPNQRETMKTEGFNSYSLIAEITPDALKTVIVALGRRTGASKINVGLSRSLLLGALVHWVKDFERIGRKPTLDGINSKEEFQDALRTSAKREGSRVTARELAGELARAANPGKFTGAKKWKDWIRAFRTYLACSLGHDGVPLDYVIRDLEEPDYSEEESITFEALSVKCAPLKGVAFQRDATSVHSMLMGLIHAEPAETWVKPVEKKKDGRVDYFALKAHYGGASNKSILINEAEALRKNLFYRNERTMSFDTFATKMAEMFTGFANNGEAFQETQKIRLLFEKVMCPQLESMKQSLKNLYNLDQNGMLDFTFIVNALATEVSGQADVTMNRRASGVTSGGTPTGNNGGGPTEGIHSEDGSIWTGYYSNFRQLSESDKKDVCDERRRLNVRNQSGKKNSNRKGKNPAANKKQSKYAKLHRKIAALKASAKEAADERIPMAPSAPVQDNAGDQFGGRNSRASSNRGS